MSELILCEREELTPIADGIRAIEGTTEEMEFGAMSQKLAEVEAEIEAQAELLGLLEEKITNKPTCSVTLSDFSDECQILAIMATVIENGIKKSYEYFYEYGSSNVIYSITIPNVICGTPIYLLSSLYQINDRGLYTEINGSAILESYAVINSYDDAMIKFIAPIVSNEDCTILYSYNV